MRGGPPVMPDPPIPPLPPPHGRRAQGAHQNYLAIYLFDPLAGVSDRLLPRRPFGGGGLRSPGMAVGEGSPPSRELSGEMGAPAIGSVGVRPTLPPGVLKGGRPPDHAEVLKAGPRPPPPPDWSVMRTCELISDLPFSLPVNRPNKPNDGPDPQSPLHQLFPPHNPPISPAT